jgi:hypothetical protein
MVPSSGNRTRRSALLVGKGLVLLLLLLSPRALYAPKVLATKAEESKRPKPPRKIVRAEPLRVPTAEKQQQSPAPTSGDVAAAYAPTSRILALPRKAFTQITKPEYLKSDSPGAPSLALPPPA